MWFISKNKLGGINGSATICKSDIINGLILFRAFHSRHARGKGLHFSFTRYSDWHLSCGWSIIEISAAIARCNSCSFVLHSFPDIVCRLSDTLLHPGYVAFFKIELCTVIHVPQRLKVPASPQMALPGVSVGSVVKALQRVDRIDFGSLLSFIEMLEASLATDREKGRVLPCASLKVSEVFELFGFSNDFIDIDPRWDYQIPEMRLNLSTPGAHLKSRDHELLKSISIVWPPANKSNVRLFVSMMTHFAIIVPHTRSQSKSTPRRKHSQLKTPNRWVYPNCQRSAPNLAHLQSPPYTNSFQSFSRPTMRLW